MTKLAESADLYEYRDSGGLGRCQNVITLRATLLELTKEAQIDSIFQEFWDETRNSGVFHEDALKNIRKKLDGEESLISSEALSHAHGLPAWPAFQIRASDSVIHFGDRCHTTPTVLADQATTLTVLALTVLALTPIAPC